MQPMHNAGIVLLSVFSICVPEAHVCCLFVARNFSRADGDTCFGGANEPLAKCFFSVFIYLFIYLFICSIYLTGSHRALPKGDHERNAQIWEIQNA